MKRIHPILFVCILVITVLFFYKLFLFGLIPFPGDLLVAEYQPWKNESFLGYVAGSYPSKAQYFDALCQMIPWKLFTWESIKNGIFPLWNPHNFSGISHVANIQAALFYPFTYIGLILPYPIAWSIIVIMQPILAGLFMLLFMGSIGIGGYGAFLAAIAFAFSQFMTVFLEYSTIGHVIVWLPLSLFAVEQYLQTKKVRCLVLFALSIILTAFAGHLQIFAASLAFILCFYFFRIYSLRFHTRLSVSIGAVFLIACGISAIQLIPTMELAFYSARSPHDIEFFLKNLLIQPKEWLLFLSPDYFGNPATRNYLLSGSYPAKALSIGLMPLIFALSVVSLKWKKDQIQTFFLFSVFILLLLVTLNPISWLLYHIPISFLTSSSPSNIQYLLSFSLAVLSGIGFDIWIKNHSSIKIRKLLLITLSILIGSLIIFQLFHMPFNVKNVLLSIIITFLFIVSIYIFQTKNKKMLLVFFIIVLTVGERFYIFQKFNPFTPSEFFFPKTELSTWLQHNAGINRFWGYGYGTIASNIATGINIYDIEGYDPLYPKWYAEFIGLSKEGVLPHMFSDENRSNATIAPGFGKNGFMENPYRLRVLNLGSVRYILDRVENGSTEESFPPSLFRQIETINDWKILESSTALPRIFLVNDYAIATSPKEQTSIIMQPLFNPKTTALLEESPQFTASMNQNIGTAVLQSYEPNKIIIQTQNSIPSILIITDTYYPGWTATIDKTRTSIKRVNYAYRAIFVPEGEHAITMRFDPPSLRIGIWVSIGSILILIAFLILYPKKK